MNDVNGSASIPPKTGIAIARATSAPRPVAINTGIKRCERRDSGHHAGSDSLESGLVNRIADVFDGIDLATLQQLMNIGRHDYAIIHRESEQRDESDPNGGVQLDLHPSDENHAAGKGDWYAGENRQAKSAGFGTGRRSAAG